LAAHAKILSAVSQPFIQISAEGELVTEESLNLNTNIRFIRMDIFPKWLTGTIWKRTNTPAHAILFTTLINTILISFDFTILVQLTMLIDCLSATVQSVAILVLRYNEPNINRPFKIPGNWVTAWIIAISRFAILFAIFMFTAYKSPAIFFSFCGFIAICCLYCAIRLSQWNPNQRQDTSKKI